MQLGFEGSPDISESVMVKRDLELAAETKAPIHFGHISSAKSVELIRKARRKGLPISAELTPHHALLTVDDILSVSMRERSLFKVCPVLRSAEDREALLRAANDATLDCFASDHAPHSKFEKDLPYNQAMHGIISLENYFSLYNEVRIRSKMTWARYFSATTTRPAELLNLNARFEKSAPASFIVFDPDVIQSLEWKASKSRNTPLTNKSLRGRLLQHWLDGKKVYES
jgi:dihydroorotase